MKNLGKLLPTFCLLLISAMLLGTSTYAWFSMNTAVTATGMKITAKAESGIVISNSETSTWTASSTTTTEESELFPTSTADFTTWYHNTSDDANSAKASQTASTYTTVTNSTTAKYFSDNIFYIKSATAEEVDCSSYLYIKSVTVTGVNGSSDLDKSLRVGISVSGDTGKYIFAPVSGATLGVKVGGSSTTTTAIDMSNSGTVAVYTPTATTSIPATATGLTIHVYVWFEGEDAACSSNNVTANLDQLTVSIQFATQNG